MQWHLPGDNRIPGSCEAPADRKAWPDCLLLTELGADSTPPGLPALPTPPQRLPQQPAQRVYHPCRQLPQEPTGGSVEPRHDAHPPAGWAAKGGAGGPCHKVQPSGQCAHSVANSGAAHVFMCWPAWVACPQARTRCTWWGATGAAPTTIATRCGRPAWAGDHPQCTACLALSCPKVSVSQTQLTALVGQLTTPQALGAAC